MSIVHRHVRAWRRTVANYLMIILPQNGECEMYDLMTITQLLLPRLSLASRNVPTFNVQRSNVQRSTFNVQRSNVQHSTFNVPTFNVQRSTFQRSTFNVPTFNVQCSTFNVQRSNVQHSNLQPSTPYNHRPLDHRIANQSAI